MYQLSKLLQHNMLNCDYWEGLLLLCLKLDENISDIENDSKKYD